MTTTNCPGADLLLLHHHGLLDEPEDVNERARLDGHLLECGSCRAWPEGALVAPPLPFDPAEVLGELHDRILAYETEAAPLSELDVNVRLLCTYCKDGLPAPQASYCADCLAPHHDDCFAEHGSCSAPGCEGRRVVRSAEVLRPARTAPRWRRAGLWVVGVALGGVGVAAFMPARVEPEVQSSADAERLARLERERALEQARLFAQLEQREAQLERLRAEAAPGDYLQHVYQVADLMLAEPEPAQVPEWIEEFRKTIASRKVTLNFPDTPLGEVVSFLQDITGLNVVLSPDVDPEAYTVSLRLREIPLPDALQIIEEQCGLASTFANESYVIHAGQGRWAVDPSHPPIRPSSTLLRGEALGEQVRSLVASDRGDDAWNAPAALSLEGTTLVVTQLASAHEVIQAYLDSLRQVEFPERFGRAWFAPAARVAPSPALERALDVQRRLQQQRITLNFDQTPFLEVLSFLHDITGVDYRLDPEVAAQLNEATVSLRLKEIKLENALELICGVDPQLVFDVDRRGILIRSSGTTPYETRLRAAAEQQLLLGDDAKRIRRYLDLRRVSLDFSEVPLSEALEFVRELCELNVVVASGLSQDVLVTLRVEAVPLSEGLEQILAPLALGYRIESGVIRVVPRKRAGERPELRPQVEAALASQLGEGLLGASVAELTEQLELAFEGEVVLGEGALGARNRLSLPPGCTVAQALGLAASEASLEHGWTWVDDRLVLALDQHGPGALVEAAILAAAPVWGGPAPLVEAEREAARALNRSLNDLADSPALGLWRSEAGVSRLETLLEQVDQGLQRLHDVRASARAFVPSGGPSVYPADTVDTPDQSDATISRLLTAHAALRRATRSTLRVRRELEQDLSEANARALAFRVERSAKRRELDAQLTGLAQDERARRFAIEDRIVQLERETSRWLNDVILGPARDALSSHEREHQLLEARLRSEISEWRGLLDDLLRCCPGYEDALARLRQGDSWDAVFPDGFLLWEQQDLEAGARQLSRGAQALEGLGLVLTPDMRVTRVSAGALAYRAGVLPGVRLLEAGGQPVANLTDLVLRLGERERAGRAIEFVFGGTGPTPQARFTLPPPGDPAPLDLDDLELEDRVLDAAEEDSELQGLDDW